MPEGVKAGTEGTMFVWDDIPRAAAELLEVALAIGAADGANAECCSE